MENLNGRKLVEEGDLCERRNGDSKYNYLLYIVYSLPIFSFAEVLAVTRERS